MAEYFHDKQEALAAIKNFYKDSGSKPVFFGKIKLSGNIQWIVDFQKRDYSNAYFEILEDNTREVDNILSD